MDRRGRHIVSQRNTPQYGDSHNGEGYHQIDPSPREVRVVHIEHPNPCNLHQRDESQHLAWKTNQADVQRSQNAMGN